MMKVLFGAILGVVLSVFLLGIVGLATMDSASPYAFIGWMVYAMFVVPIGAIAGAVLALCLIISRRQRDGADVVQRPDLSSDDPSTPSGRSSEEPGP